MRTGRPPAPRAVGVALIPIGLGATATAMGISLDQYGRWGARVFPLAGSLSLVVLGAIELWTARDAPALDRRHLTGIAALLALSIGYVWTMSAMGYLIVTALAAPAALWIFGVRNRLGLATAAVLAPAIYHLIFFELLQVFPPLGRWFDLLDLVGRV